MRTEAGPIREPRDFWSGLIFGVAGVAPRSCSAARALGTATKMGPGYFPTVLGVLLALIGLALIVRAFLLRAGRIAGLAVRPLVLVLGATVLFGLTLREPASSLR